MDFAEHEGKDLLGRFGIRVPRGSLARDPVEAMTAARTLGACVVKAQVLRGGRGKSGLVRFAATPDEAGRAAADLLSLQGADEVPAVLVEERLDIRRELYLAIRVDDVAGAPRVLASASGGMNVEGHAAEVHSQVVDVLAGFRRHHAVDLWKRVGLSGRSLQEAVEATASLWHAFQSSDAMLLEINPLIIDGDERCWAADAKLSVDDAAFDRHPPWRKRAAARSGTPLEQRAVRLGVNSFVEMSGNIALISTGASLGMLVLDGIVAHGGRPANFMDMGGQSTGFSREKIVELVSAHATENPTIRAILITMIQTSRPLKMTTDGILNALRTRPAPCPVFCWIGAAHLATRDRPLEAVLDDLRAAGIRAYPDLQETLAATVAATHA